MELEQRVKALEYEVKILKNEIQRTLLDIQEQVLVHYYPTLRSEESGPSEGTVQAVEALRAKQAAPTPVPAAVPTAKKVSLDEIRAAQSAAAAPAPAPAAGTALDAAAMVKLSGWVTESAAKMGGQRTARLVQACASTGILTPQVAEMLARLASLGADSGPAAVAVNEVLGVVLKLDEVLGRAADVEEALSVIEEAKLG